MPLPFTALAQFIAAALSRYGKEPTPPLETTAEIGTYGERVAAAFVRRNGYRVLTRNFESERGELDLICREGNVLVFVEVRTRSGDLFGRPSESIDERKEAALLAAAHDYLELLDGADITHRFDAVEVRLKRGQIPECTLLRNIFG